MSRSGFGLKAPTSTISPSVVANVPTSGMRAQFSVARSISAIVASRICIASSESYSDTSTRWPRPVR